MEAYRIVLEGSEAVIDCPAEETLLHTALRQGVGFPYECSSGACGTCQYQLVSGDMENLWPDAPGLSERARRKGDRLLACQSRPRSDAVIKVQPEDRCRPVIQPDHWSAQLVEVEQLTHDMWEFTLQTQAPVIFRPGQYVLLTCPSVVGGRAYSMSNLPNEDGIWRFIIKRKAGGALTRQLFETARPGDRFELKGPYGMAYLRDSVRDIVCISGGSGLSPILSIVRGALADGAAERGRRIEIFHGGRQPRDIVDPRALPDLSAAADRMIFRPAISSAEAADWTGERGFIHEVADRHMSEATDIDVYLGGPPPMIGACLTMLEARGIDRSRIHFDSFY